MTKKMIAGIVLVSLAAAGGGYYYFIYLPKHPFGKDLEKAKGAAIDYLVKTGHGDTDSLAGFDADYVVAWATALKNGKATFTREDGKTYSVSNGRVVQ